MDVEHISVFGLGKLGATMVGCFAASGYQVIGIDIDESAVECVESGSAPVPEPGLQELYEASHERIRATMNVGEAIAKSSVSFIIVPTPSTPEGEFFTTIATTVADEIGGALGEKDGYHLVVLTSTVLPGATDRDIKTALERTSGKRCGQDFGLCYSPEFIAIGNVIEGLVNPDFFLIGEHDKRSGDVLESIYARVRQGEAPVVRMGIVNAELTKISVNAFVTSKISFANSLARVCSKLPRGDARVVADAVGLDKRIGRHYLTPGGAFGGPCFPRDNRAFEWFARSLGEEMPQARATDDANKRHIDFLVDSILAANTEVGCVGLLGLSYKPRTNLMAESQSVAIVQRLLGRGVAVQAYDPWVAKYGMSEAIDGLAVVESMSLCIRGADAVALCVQHSEFSALKPMDFCTGEAPVPLVDIWGMLREAFNDQVFYSVPGSLRRSDQPQAAGQGDGAAR